MKHLVRLCLLAVAWATAQSSETPRELTSPAAAAAEVAAALHLLDAWITANVAKHDLPGLSIGIVHDQALLWAKGYGLADLQREVPATPRTLYRLGSITKVFTATAILQLRDAGRLRLDDTVVAHLPWFQMGEPASGSADVTIRHLLTHTGGLPKNAAGLNWSDLTFPSRDDLPRVLRSQSMVLPPGTEWKYSNLGFALAGAIVAEVSGLPWSQHLRQRILEPLGMAATDPHSTQVSPGLAIGYTHRRADGRRKPHPVPDLGATTPAGGLASSVADLARFVSLQFKPDSPDARRVLSADTLDEMHRVHWMLPDWQTAWGLGFALRRVGEQLRIGHDGDNPGFNAALEFAPALKLGVIVLINSDDGDPMRYVDQAFTLVGGALPRADKPAPPATRPDPAWRSYVGRYAGPMGWTMEIIVHGHELAMIDPGADDAIGSRTVLTPVGPHMFRMTAVGLNWRSIGELLTFELDSAGCVVRLRDPNFDWRPVR